jgi:nucleolin
LFDGRNINVDYSQPRTGKPRENTQSRANRYGDVQGTPQDTLFVGNLSFDSTYDLVKETFEPFGSITRVSLPTDRESGQMKGFGYVSFSSVEEAKAAIDALNGSEIAGRPIRLDYATARPAGEGNNRGGRGGGGFGGGRGGGRGRGFEDRGRGGDRGGRGRGGFNRGGSTNRGGFGDFSGRKTTF